MSSSPVSPRAQLQASPMLSGASPSSYSPQPASISASTRETSRVQKAQEKAEKAIRQAARSGERASLVVRRDTLAYFDTARALGPQVFLDTIPAVFNGVFVVTFGNIVKGLDGLTFIGGNDHLCPQVLHLHVAVLILSYLFFLGYMSWIALGMGGRGTSMINTHISIPWFVLLMWFSGVAAWSALIGIPVILSNLSSTCATSRPSLFCEIIISVA